MLFRTAKVLLAVSAATIVVPTVQAGPDWLEGLDAGSGLMTAQDTTSVGPVATISGNLGLGDGEDLFLIQILATDAFAASTSVRFGGTFDTQLWLFDAQGFGLLGNDNDPTGGFGSFITVPSDDGVTLVLPGPGLYYLGITESGNEPLSENGSFPMFDFLTDTEISGPDGLGGSGMLGPWTGGPEIGGEYFVQIMPTPGALLPLVAFAALRPRRRRG